MSIEERLRGLEQYKETLQHVMDVYPNAIRLKVPATPVPHWIYPNMPEWVTNGGTANTPLTSTSWDGDSYSTTAKTLIDLSVVFGVPAGVKAVLLFVRARDSGSATADTFLVLGPTNAVNIGMTIDPHPVNDRWSRECLIVPCNFDGDIYYQIGASGSGTFDVLMQVWGYYS